MSDTYQLSVCWLRRDLRLQDHAALASATSVSNEVALLFVFDTTILNKLKDRDDRRVTFIWHSLRELEAQAKNVGSQIVVRYGDPKDEVPKVARKLKAQALFTNHDYEPSSKQRDAAVEKELGKSNIDFHTFKDQVIFERDEILTNQGSPYKVFTPYKRKWLEELDDNDIEAHRVDLERLVPKSKVVGVTQKWDLGDLGFEETELWLKPGAKAARRRLGDFNIGDYAESRNFPAVEGGTSGLSVHLRFGTLSIRKLIRFAREQRGKSANVWLSELIWRDFYQMILDRFPHVTQGAFKPEYDKIEWSGKQSHYEAWKQGRTGFPIIDAAMRHFSATGWMHNRLRMIVASFLIKDLLIDWRKGEEWFARNLLDFDLAANNGGWQWCASTGCDAQPYFRIFNPTSQSKKFDPDGEFIRNLLPELSEFPNRLIHTPWKASAKQQQEAACQIGKDYPWPIIDHAVQREKVLRLFKKARRS